MYSQLENEKPSRQELISANPGKGQTGKAYFVNLEDEFNILIIHNTVITKYMW